MPRIRKETCEATHLIGFNNAMSSNDIEAGIHFYLDDYQFERFWKTPQKYINILKKFKYVFSPDFSLYLDMPMAMKIWNTYRNRFLGNLMQQNGIIVIPTISWAEKETFDFCFDGVDKNSIVSISTMGVIRNKHAVEIWKSGVKELIQRVNPCEIWIYGNKIEFNFENIKVKYFKNEITNRLKSYVK